MKLRVAFFLTIVCLTVVLYSCRKNQPSLIDANRAPDTELWYAPLDSTEYDWNVHMYWRGIDLDGVVKRFIWTVTDTVEADPLIRWNPAERVVDLRAGRITERTDSVIAFRAYTNVAGVGLKKNRQAFHVAAIDDNGVIDPSPAVIEFVATVGLLPQMRFMTTITSVDPNTGESTRRTKRYNPAVLDTVGMFRPLSLSFRGFTTNGLVTAYKYFPLTSGVVVPGQDIWYEDLSDTIRYFPNRGEDVLPSGVFRFVAQCRDQSGAESRADVKTSTEGVVQVAVNYEPDTEITQVENTYYLLQQKFTRFLSFKDDIPDTVPYGSWVRIDYRGWDNSKDSLLCEDDLNKCIKYQVQYERESSRVAGSNFRTLWLPQEPKDDNPNGTPDSTSLNLGSVEYTVRARAVDEFKKGDGTMANPATGKLKSQVWIVGNYDPTLDQAVVANYDGTAASKNGDEVVWDWWHPANYTGNPQDTTEIDGATGKTYAKKIFYVEISGRAHDHPTENARFGVRGWQYRFLRTDTMEKEPFFAGQEPNWLDSSPGVFTRRFEVEYRYDIAADPGGASFFENPPSFWNSEYEFSLKGRDLPKNSEFNEFMFVEKEQLLLNSFQSTPLARETEIRTFRFFLRVAR